MATLADIASNVTDMLRRTGDTSLAAPIKQEIGNAIAHYNRRVNWLQERRAGIITTVVGQTWYDTIDNSASEGFSDTAVGTAPTSTDNTKDLLSLIYAKLELGTIDWPLDVVPYVEFEQLVENTAVEGTPRYITRYAGRIGLWPTPNEVYSVTISGFWKPGVPTADAHESVWFDEHRELVEAAAARKVAQKWLHDPELTQLYAGIEADQKTLLDAEGVARMTTGRLKSTPL